MIYMVDGTLNPRIQVFDTDGNFVTSIGTKGNGDGELSKPEPSILTHQETCT